MELKPESIHSVLVYSTWMYSWCVTFPSRSVELKPAQHIYFSLHQINHIEQKHIEGNNKKRSLKTCTVMDGPRHMARIDKSQS